MAELKPCPFCGGDAEIFTGRNFPRRGKSLCESEVEALEQLKQYRSKGTVSWYHVGKNKYSRINMKVSREKWRVTVELKAFIPRCRTTNCLGRTQMMYLSEDEAADAWNRRAEE